jgi:tRNA nucleotidyltransferase (CCA-adding enzyme)
VEELMSESSSKESLITSIFEKVLARVKPGEDIKRKLMMVYEEIKALIHYCLESRGLINFETSLQGSVAKDTFLKDEVDLDMFILFDPARYDTKWINEEFVNIITRCLQSQGYNTILKYAAHPYVTAYVNGIEVDIVPAFRVDNPKNIISAVDRTPFHTHYVKSRLLEEKLRDEVRLLKAFLRAWNLYGAEIKVQGFSGYLTELLVIKYGSFLNVLKAAISWRAYKTCIEIEEYYGNEKACKDKFKKDVLVVVDPVDPDRNAAAALSIRSYACFKMLARLFLEKPAIEFFETSYEVQANINEIAKLIEERQKALGSCIIILHFNITKNSPDIVWGQLKRIQRVIKNTLEKYGYKGVHVDTWINDEMSRALTVLELMDCSDYEFHMGPPAYSNEAISFLKKNINAIIGPWIDDKGRIVCIRKRKHNPIEVIRRVIESSVYTSVRLEEIKKIVSVDDVKAMHDVKFMMWFKNFLLKKHFDKIMKTLI